MAAQITLDTIRRVRVGVVFCVDDQWHAELGLATMDRLRQRPKVYEPSVLPVEFDEKSAMQGLFLVAQGRFDVIMVVGEFFSLLLQEIYVRNHDVSTIFMGVPDPVRAGLVKSLDRPGGYFSGVNMQPISVADYAEKVALLGGSHFRRVALLCNPEIYSGQLKEHAAVVTKILESQGISVLEVSITSPESVLVAVENCLSDVDGIMSLESCVSNMVLCFVAAMCHKHNKAFITCNGKQGILGGATLSYGPRDLGRIADEGIAMLDRYSLEHKLLAFQPVVTLSDERIYRVNETWLRHLGDVQLLVEKLQARDDIKLVRYWPNTTEVDDYDL